MKKICSLITALAMILVVLFSLSGCAGGGGVKIIVPKGGENEIRALRMLEANGYLKLKEELSESEPLKGIAENPYHITIVEAEPAQIAGLINKADFAILDPTGAAGAGLDPQKALLAESADAAEYGEVLAVKEGYETEPAIRALAAALRSKKAADFMAEKYGKTVVSAAEKPGGNYDPSINYIPLSGVKLTVASPAAPHGEILAVAKEILAMKNITLEIVEITAEVKPNAAVESGEIIANYCQRKAAVEAYNEQNNAHLVCVAAIHLEPLCLYATGSASLEDIKK